MDSKLNWVHRRLHLIISTIIVIPTALIYGLSPSTLLPQYLDIQVETIDLSNFMRAIMCLYLGISCIWILGILKGKYWKVATQLNLLFMTTLGAGRLLSIVIDGMPTGGYIFGVVAEFVLAVFAFLQLCRD